MTRFTATVTSYVQESHLELRILADITFTNTAMRLHTGVGSLMVGTTHYDGIGSLGSIDKVSESGLTFTSGVKLTLSAVEGTILSEAISESLFGKAATLSRAWLRDGVLVDTPHVWYRGEMGEVNIKRGDPERGNYIETTLHTKLDRARHPTYYTAEDLAMTYSGDTFFKHLHKIQGQKALWGDKATYFDNQVISNMRLLRGVRRRIR
jgi:hypothetical protein